MNAQSISATEESYRMGAGDIAPSKPRIWISRVFKGIATLFLLMDGGIKLFKPPFVVQATVQMGYPESTIVGIGLALLICTLLYVIPRTAVLGAIVLTGYLGGAVASNVRAATPFLNIAFPILFAVVIWAPLILRNNRLASMLFNGR